MVAEARDGLEDPGLGRVVGAGRGEGRGDAEHAAVLAVVVARAQADGDLLLLDEVLEEVALRIAEVQAMSSRASASPAPRPARGN